MSDEKFRLTAAGKAMVAELDYGHNPRAYLCSERPHGQSPTPHELCILCSDGFEAVTWKRTTMALQVELLKLARELEGEAQDWSNDPAAMGAKADAAARIRELLR